MVTQELDSKPRSSFNRALRFFGFLLSVATLYLMVVWTLELSQVKVDDLPVIHALEPDFKKGPVELVKEDNKNEDLSINALRGNEKTPKVHDEIKPIDFEESLTGEENPVPLSMKAALENSINRALNSLAKEEVISQKAIYHVYLGSFDSHDAASAKLEMILKNGKLKMIGQLKIVSGVFDGNKTIFRIETSQPNSYEKAKQICAEMLSKDFDCTVITG